MKVLTQVRDVGAVEAELRRHQKTAEQVAQLASDARAFSFAEWQQRVRPATSDELADWEQFLRDRDTEREISLAREPDPAEGSRRSR